MALGVLVAAGEPVGALLGSAVVVAMSTLAVVAAVSRRQNDHKAKEYSYNQAALHLLLLRGPEAVGV